MAKKKIGVAVIVVLILVLFVVFVYLMSIVNPKPLKQQSTNGFLKTHSIDDQKEVVFLNPGQFSYELKKASKSDIAKQVPALAKMIPLYRHLATQGLLLNDSYTKKVVSPINPPGAFENRSSLRIDSNLSVSPIIPSVKGYRRSVNNIESTNRIIKENSGVILKIIDDSGHPRIEIKLEPAEFYGKRRKYGSSVNGKVYNNSGVLMEDFIGSAKSTVIKVLPNNTVIFDDNENLVHIIQNNVTSEDNNEGTKLSDNIATVNNIDSQRYYKEITVLKISEDHKDGIRVSSNDAYWNNTDTLHFNMLGNITTTQQSTHHLTENNVLNNNTALNIVCGIANENTTDSEYDGKTLPSNTTSRDTNIKRESFNQLNTTDSTNAGKITSSYVTSIEMNIVSDSFDQVNTTTDSTYDGKITSSHVTSIETNIVSDSFDQVNNTTDSIYNRNIMSSHVISIETNIASDSFDQVNTTTNSTYDGKIMSSHVTSIETNIVSDSFDQVTTTTDSTYDGNMTSSHVTSIETNIVSDSFDEANTTTNSIYDGKIMSSYVTSIETPTEIQINRNISDLPTDHTSISNL